MYANININNNMYGIGNNNDNNNRIDTQIKMMIFEKSQYINMYKKKSPTSNL